MATKKTASLTPASDFDALVSTVAHIHHQAQEYATKAINISLTLRNWLIGQRIVEFEQKGRDRATYGESLLDTLSDRLSQLSLTRSNARELRRYRQLYQAYPKDLGVSDSQILGSQRAWQPAGLAASGLGSQRAWQPAGLAASLLFCLHRRCEFGSQ